MAQLPTDLHIRISLSASDISEVKKAYSSILELEQTSPNAENLIHARILGYLIREGPTKEAVMYVTSEVRSCDGPRSCYDLGQSYMNRFICVCESQLLFSALSFLPL